MGETVDQFLRSLEQLEVGWTRAAAEHFPAALSDVIEPPAVGAPLPFEAVSLEGTEVTTAPSPKEVDEARTGVTAVRMGIADYGSILIEARPDATEAASLFPALHVAVLRAADVVPDMAAAFQQLGPALRKEPTSAILATGPSTTADMGALVRGAHGPKRVHVIMIDAP
jgi:L-lactate dehydrogenase complex protein LldG